MHSCKNFLHLLTWATLGAECLHELPLQAPVYSHPHFPYLLSGLSDVGVDGGYGCNIATLTAIIHVTDEMKVCHIFFILFRLASNQIPHRKFSGFEFRHRRSDGHAVET